MPGGFRERVCTGRPFIIVLCLLVAVAVVVTIDMGRKNGRSLAAKCSFSPPPAGRAEQKARYRALDAKQFIPGNPSALVVCRYEGAESTGWQLRLEAHIPVASRDIARVVSATRVPLKVGDHSCPMEASEHMVYLIAGFTDAPDLVTWIRDRCGVAGNGSFVGAFVPPSAESAILAALPRTRESSHRR